MSGNYKATATVLLNGQQAEDMLGKLKKRSEELGKQWAKFSDAGDVAGMKKIEKEIKSVDKATEKLRKDTLTVEKVLKNLSGATLEELRIAQRKLNQEMNKMDRNGKDYAEAAKKMQLLNGEIKNAKVATGQWRSPMQKMLDSAKGLLPAFGFAAIVAAGKAAFTKIVSATDALGTRWDIFTGGLKAGMNEFWRSIAAGDWSNFTENMKEAIRTGREYQAVLDQLEEQNRALSLAESDALEEQLKLEDKVRNSSLSSDERIAAAERRIQLEEELAAKRTKIATKAYENEVMITAQQTRLGKDRLLEIMKDLDSETKAKAGAYNAQMEEIRQLERAQLKTGMMGEGMMVAPTSDSPRLKQLKAETAAASDAVKLYAEALTGLGTTTDQQLDKLVQTYGQMKQAEVSSLENTRRVRSTMYSELEKINNEEAAAAKKAAEETKKKIQDSLDLAALLEADQEKQKAAIEKYFREAGEGAYEAFLAAIDKSREKDKIGLAGTGIEQQEEKEDPTTDYAIEKYKETIDFKMALNRSLYDNGIISEMEYQDTLTKLTRQAEAERYEIKQQNIEKFNGIAQLGANVVSTLMDMELQGAGDNEEKKLAIKKKYADAEFAINAAGIISSTALAIMKTWAGFSDMPIIGQILAAVQTAFLAAQGMTQLAKANQARSQIKALAKGKYPVAADDGKIYDATFAGRPTTGIYSGPQLGIFNEVPGQPEMVIDGITNRRLQLNYPGIVNAIYAVRRGAVPQYAAGKYPEDVAASGTGTGAGTAKVGLIDNSIMERQIRTMEKLDASIREFMTWRPAIGMDAFERQQANFRRIQNGSGMNG